MRVERQVSSNRDGCRSQARAFSMPAACVALQDKATVDSISFDVQTANQFQQYVQGATAPWAPGACGSLPPARTLHGASLSHFFSLPVPEGLSFRVLGWNLTPPASSPVAGAFQFSIKRGGLLYGTVVDDKAVKVRCMVHGRIRQLGAIQADSSS